MFNFLGKIFPGRVKGRFILFLVILIYLIFCCSFSAPALIFFDIGQGDASLILAPNGKTILIDGGPDWKILEELGQQLPFYHRYLDYIIFTHYHADHITGLIEIINRYQVGSLVYAPTSFNSLLLETLLKTAKERNLKLITIKSTGRIELAANCFLDLINPLSLGISQDENNSLTARLDCAGLSALLAGDNNIEVEKALIKAWPLKADIFKASHHGSKTANSQAFLEAIKPRIVVISLGKNNRFGHPHQEVLQRFQDLGIFWQRTDEEGTIKFLFSNP